MSQCPVEKTLIATVLYLEQNKELFKLSKNNLSDIAYIIENDIKNFLESSNRYNEIKTNLKHTLPLVSITSKSLLAGVNTIYDKEFTKTITDEFKLCNYSTKYNADINIEVFEQKTNTKELQRNIKIDDEYLYMAYDSLPYKILNELFNQEIQDEIENNYQLDEFLKNLYSDINSKIDTITKAQIPNNFLEINGTPLNLNGIKKDIFNEIVESSVQKAFENVDDPLIEIIGDDISFTQQLQENISFLYDTKTKENLSYLFEAKTENKKRFNDALSYDISFSLLENRSQLLDILKKEEKPLIEFKFYPENEVFYIPFQKKDNKYTIKLETSHVKINNDLTKKEKVKITPQEISVDFSTPTPEFFFHFNDKIDTIKKMNVKNDRRFMTHSNFKNKFATIAIDESDQDPNGTVQKTLRQMAKNSENVIGASGTGFTGRTTSIATQSSLDGVTDKDEVESEWKQNFGIFSVKQEVIRYIMNFIDDQEFVNKLNLHFSDFANSKKSNDINKTVENTVNLIVQTAKEKDYDIEGFDFFRASNTIKSLFKNLTKKEFRHLKLSESIPMLVMNSSQYTKEVSGIGAVNSLISAISKNDVVTDINTREGLTSKKEKVHFKDLDRVFGTKNAIINKNISDDTIEQTNFAPKVLYEFIKKESEKNYTAQTFMFLTTNFDFFIDSFTKSKDVITKGNFEVVANIADMDKDEFLHAISKSSSSKDDDIKMLYRSYLRNNGKIDIEDPNKLKAFKGCIKAFEQLHISKIDDKLLRSYSKNDENKLYTIGNTYAPSQLQNLFGESISLSNVFELKNGYPISKFSNNPLNFTYNVTLHKSRWDEFMLKDDKGNILRPLTLTIGVLNSNAVEVLENYASKGKENVIDEAIIDGKKTSIASSRVLTAIMNVYDVISSASKRPNKNEPFVVVYIKSAEAIDYLKNIDKSFLERNNIEFLPVDSKRIASEIKSLDAKKLQYTIIGGYSQMARGLDLSNVDLLISTDPKTRLSDGIQYLSRQFNPHKNKLDGNIYMFNGGEDVSVALSYSEVQETENYLSDISSTVEYVFDETHLLNDGFGIDNKTEKFILSDNSISTKMLNNIGEDILFDKKQRSNLTYGTNINLELNRSYNWYKTFMNGERTDTILSNYTQPLITTKYYEKEIEKTQDRYNEIENSYEEDTTPSYHV